MTVLVHPEHIAKLPSTHASMYICCHAFLQGLKLTSGIESGDSAQHSFEIPTNLRHHLRSETKAYDVEVCEFRARNLDQLISYESADVKTDRSAVFDAVVIEG